MIPTFYTSRPAPSLLYRLYSSVDNTHTRFDFGTICFLPYDYDRHHRNSLKAIRIAWWKHLSHIRNWLPPWKQQFLPQITPSTHTTPVRHPLRLLTAITVRRERFQWKRKMTRRALISPKS